MRSLKLFLIEIGKEGIGNRNILNLENLFSFQDVFLLFNNLRDLISNPSLLNPYSPIIYI